jgi:hypothetical protein
MNTKKTTTLISCLIALFLISFKAEETPLEKLIKQLKQMTESYPQEKIHLHLDKPIYAVGENIWLKAYVVTAEKNEPSLISKVLYVDLIGEDNELKKKLILPIEKGFSGGNISLIDSLKTGNYRIRAYTNYMRNYDKDFFFEKFITIGDITDISEAYAAKEKKLELNVQFFPEGGQLINGIRSKVGVKAVSSDGLGVDISGYIENKSNEKVAVFNTLHVGMGVFAFTPQPNERYRAVIALPDGKTKSFEIPKALENGYVLSVNRSEDNIRVQINASPDRVNNKDVYVIGQANGTVYASFTSKLDKNILTANIPKKSFPTGIIQFTLFDSDIKPIAERLTFVNHNDDLKIAIKNNNSASFTKKKNEMTLQVADINGAPIDGNFSLAVLDESKVKIDEDNEVTILSNLLLTSDLKGFIEKPNYYFNHVNEDRESYLDYLLLTQGWRRFYWEDVYTQKEPEINFRPEQSIEIAGKVKNLNNKPISNAKITMFSNTPGYTFILDTISDVRGNFVFDRLDIPDIASFILQSKTSKDNKNIILSANPPAEIATKRFIGNKTEIAPYITATKNMFSELNKFNMLDKSIQLNTVKIVGQRAPIALINVPNSANASGAADYVIKSDKLKNETSIFTIFSKIPGVMVRSGKIVRSSARTVSLTSTTQPPMLMIVDGVYINQDDQPDYISSIMPDDIAGIEVLSSNYNTSVYGSEGYWGVVFITTKNGRGGSNPPSSNTISVRNRGFSKIKEFYAPNYDDPKTNTQMQDLRSTIYWNNNINTNENGKASFSFFNAGTPGNYKVIVEGMDTFGNIGRKVYTYEVK